MDEGHLGREPVGGAPESKAHGEAHLDLQQSLRKNTRVGKYLGRDS